MTPSPLRAFVPSCLRASPGDAGWLSLDEASRRSGKSLGHLRRLCSDKWLAEGNARLSSNRQSEIGNRKSRPFWEVREDADASLAKVKFPEQICSDLRQVPESKRREALRRRKVLSDWSVAKAAKFTLGFNEAQITEQFLSHLEAETGERLSRRTLYYWEKRWRQSGLAGLVDARGNHQSAISNQQSEDPFLAEVRRLYLTPRKLKLTVAWEIASLRADENGWAKRSYKTCQRFLDALPRAVVVKQRFGEEAYVNEVEPYIERDYSGLRSNEIWCGDHHQFDVIVRGGDHGKLLRPWLTAWQDVRSRKIVGWHVFGHDPNSHTILTALRTPIIELGAPEAVMIDNGKDYDCWFLNGRTKKDRWEKRRIRLEIDVEKTGGAGLFEGLGIDCRHVKPYHGQSKPIERFFGTLEQHTPVWATYCGRSTAHKPGDLQLQLERGNAPTLADFSVWFDDWMKLWNATHEHSGDAMDGKTPDAVYAENYVIKRVADSRLLDLLCLEVVDEATVHQNGVIWRGIHYGQYESELQRRLGEKVRLRVDERDVTRVQVYSVDDRFLCLAGANERLPVAASAQDVRRANADKARDRKLRSEYIDRRPRMADDLPQRMLAAMAAKSRLTVGPQVHEVDGPSLQPIRHPLESQLDAVQRATEARSNKQAVGSESTPLPTRFEYRRTAPAEDDPGEAAPFRYEPEE